MRRWAEDDALRRVSGRYCPFAPAPRSTIAVAYSADGKTLASTHGDHTVKLIECATGRMVRSAGGTRTDAVGGAVSPDEFGRAGERIAG